MLDKTAHDREGRNGTVGKRMREGRKFRQGRKGERVKRREGGEG